MFELRYGLKSDRECSDLEIELAAFLINPPKGLGREEHFWNVTSLLWGPKSSKPFVRHPWAEDMTYEACRQQYLGLSGCGSSGKTDWAAVWGIVNWLAAPKDTLVFCTSTSLKESGKRIWGSVKAYYAAAGLEGVGKLVDSLHAIRTKDGSGVFNDKEGIYCIAAEKKDEKDAIGKLIGAKNKRVILLADELPELTTALESAAKSNLALNPYFQMIGLGNFKSCYDPFGEFIEPKAGWASIKVEDDEWETRTGLCLHFDGMRSPNITEGKDRWPIYDSKNLAQHRKNYGPDSAEFWRMCRSFQTPIGTSDTIYTEADLISGQAKESRCEWARSPIMLSAMDPSFTSGGDRAIQMIGELGQCTDGMWRLLIRETIILFEDVADKAPRDYQIARMFRKNCVDRGVSPKNAALDVTGAGSVLWSIIAEEWDKEGSGREVYGVNFSGSPSKLFVRGNDTNTADKLFDRRVSELWWVGREFMKYGQIRGLDDDTCRELLARKYDTLKGSEGLKTVVETKRDMKKRLGFSPDKADCFAVLLDLSRQRHKFLAGGEFSGQNGIEQKWDESVRAANVVYENVDYSSPDVADLGWDSGGSESETENIGGWPMAGI